MLDLKNNPVFSKKPYYDEDSNVCVLLSEKAIFSPLGRIDRRAFFAYFDRYINVFC